ncbi:hypothetical protein [Oceanobacter mangrovi]|uniref:hypothetical protein n=1 Tax=Oceanobacter mangrovi TaxID=2862510 RepID=UPI001C8E110D|nr:hypothetical protein [Oceanobacter mangrovi]
MKNNAIQKTIQSFLLVSAAYLTVPATAANTAEVFDNLLTTRTSELSHDKQDTDSSRAKPSLQD